ncbi:histidine--tRNA ligase [Prauserella muralis]|uniref:Histidine--tRNA ligase n=1 Tax=Prauserella muralis TaxID=588067 RepID=A0A2V4BCT2_9PSEU|nr:histidine--tRNA ligase [Prauserella muralis]PXY32322.1 histidine--tRNA ligase [Prauserella muralis]TWE23999.1 histidyl-tRNA synthetase [Prauserella muralis]
MKIDNSPARGTRDLLPAAVAVRDHVLSTITEVYGRYGYQRIETPALERIERLSGGQGGENEKMIFQVLRRGLPDRVEAGTELAELVDLGLRYDLTVPLARFYGQHRAELPTPFRSFQFGPVWRAERPQKGRYRQFYQCDIDMIGEPSMLAEAELIEATTHALNRVGLTDTTVRISDRRFLATLATEAGVPAEAQDGFFITLDKLDKIGWDGVAEELGRRGFESGVVSAARERIEALGQVPGDKVTDVLGEALPSLAEDVVADIGTTGSCLNEIGAVHGIRWEFDPTLVRGMGYYTGHIFEVTAPGAAGSVAGGGRYDNLVGRSLGTDVPACGFSIGFERIVDLLSEPRTSERLAVLYDGDVPTPTVLTTARELRDGGRAVAPVRRSGKFAAQLKRLEAAGFTAFVHLRADQDGLEERPLRGEN